MKLSLTCSRFTAGRFWEAVAQASGAPVDSKQPDQVRYLISYLENDEVRARSMVIESPYVDRHYLHEYQGYYATALRPPPSHTKRIHLFDHDLDQAGLEQLALRIGSGQAREVRQELQAHYLGFTVIRPLPTAPIGRTLLTSYTREPARCFGDRPVPHRVHLLGQTLKVQGVPFHQQDQAVGACATAAVWCALATVLRRDGDRAPTPLEVTRRADETLQTGRILPAASGLNIEQMISAVSRSGYEPQVLKPDAEFDGFNLVLTTYLRSGIPVVLELGLEDEGTGHAITLVGFRTSDDADTPPLEVKVSESRTLRAAGITRLYAHDDRLGPYARLIWRQPAANAEVHDKFPTLVFDPRTPGFERFERPMCVWAALIPLYPKIRISAQDLILFATKLLPMAEFLARAEKPSLRVEMSFLQGGRYLEGVTTLGLKPERTRTLLMEAMLSRYVGLIRFRVESGWLLDVVCDTTDIRRDMPQWAPVLAMIPRQEEALDSLRRFAEQYGSHPLMA